MGLACATSSRPIFVRYSSAARLRYLLMMVPAATLPCGGGVGDRVQFRSTLSEGSDGTPDQGGIDRNRFGREDQPVVPVPDTTSDAPCARYCRSNPRRTEPDRIELQESHEPIPNRMVADALVINCVFLCEFSQRNPHPTN